MAVSITLRNIIKKYGDKTALNNVTLGVEKGHIHAIIGTTGSGKSTLLRVIATLSAPSLGSGYINGLNLGARQNQIRQQIGYMAQDSRFEESLTLLENLVLQGKLHGIDQADLLNRISGFVTRFNVVDQLHAFPSEVSHGTRRKMEFIRAVLHNPSILLLDEPSASLDLECKELMETFLHEQKLRFTTVLVSSNIDQVEKIADRISILDDGRLVADGTLKELKESEQEDRILDITLSETDEKDINILDAAEGIISYRARGNQYEIVMESSVNSETVIALFNGRVTEAVPRLPTLADIFKRMVKVEAIHE
ncbi:MAG: ABC transporter ATP-binding protein [Candidatus Marinimicrobia bacterium]|nr:ABC transporter ATP-binding protein [Candidatus Neomarinimicrobiota bacterium]MCF7850073.1 ABC transporter ATP-binding protein [Candidatus Neomarinimicrobiota bacterium]MCF7904839.1 ABC transporter ATP-binding protein [Candidatus Neomarinimicrobiota bacterium]